MEQLPAAWQTLIQDHLPNGTLEGISTFLARQEEQGRVIFPPKEQRFSALEMVQPEDVRVVILGQDPYHGVGQANGMCFSVSPGVKPPPSLVNIFKEIARDLGFSPPQHGDLSHWAKQGVLLLNAVLTVEEGRAASHQKQGWEAVSDVIISQLASNYQNIVFMLWGSHAERKRTLIDEHSHLILTSPHPSPLSAYRGFIGNGHFSEANRYLAKYERQAIDWRIPG